MGGGLFWEIRSRTSGEYFSQSWAGGGTLNIVFDAVAGVRGVGCKTENMGSKVNRLKLKGLELAVYSRLRARSAG